jgi:hypothetical protein
MPRQWRYLKKKGHGELNGDEETGRKRIYMDIDAA